jgi:hypothetical protein
MFDVLLPVLLLFATAASAHTAVRYVDANSANPTPPYTTWPTGAVTIGLARLRLGAKEFFIGGAMPRGRDFASARGSPASAPEFQGCDLILW